MIEKIDYLHRELNANVHRGLHYLSEECTSEYEAAREQVRALIGAASVREIVFTAGATAAINTVAYSFGEKYIHAGDNVITTEMEHHANIVPWQLICERKGAELRVVPVRRCGAPDDRKTAGTARRTDADRLHHAGVERAGDAARPVAGDRPVAPGRGAGAGGRLSGYCARRGRCAGARLRFLCLFGDTNFTDLPESGVLYGKEKWLEQMPPFMGGGDMVGTVRFSGTTYAELPLKFEAGTSNYIGAIGLGEAIRYLGTLDADEVARHEHDCWFMATERLQRSGRVAHLRHPAR